VEVRQWDAESGEWGGKPETGNLRPESEGSTPSPFRGEGRGEGGVGAGGFLSPVDSILCSNVLEHIKDEHAALRNMHAVLKPGGRLVLVVPAGKWLHGSMDRVLGHWRRYSKTELVKQLSGEGFDTETVFSMNKPGVLGWFMNGKVFHRKTLGKFQMKLFNALVPLFKVVDPLLPWTGLSLVVVARKR
jgi:SAM-dependent methyltransferase